MPDRQKILHELDHQVADADWCDNDWKDNVPIWMLRGALVLLREQEAVKPISAHVWAHTFGRCGNCEAPLPALEGLRSKFCWMCGKAVKWDAGN